MSLVQTVVPAQEPISPEEVKTQAEIIDSEHDSMIELILIPAARRYAEHYCQRAFITQEFRLTLDGFGRPGNARLGFFDAWIGGQCEIHIPIGGVQTVDSITYIDTAGVTQTLAPADYVVDADSTPARIAPAYGKTWPLTRPQIANVRVSFTAGYGDDPADVPEGIRNWMLVRVATLYRDREENVLMERGQVQALPYMDSLLDPYRAWIAS